MIDEQRRGARVRDLPELLAEVVALARIEAGRGLVEAEEPGCIAIARATPTSFR